LRTTQKKQTGGFENKIKYLFYNLSYYNENTKGKGFKSFTKEKKKMSLSSSVCYEVWYFKIWCVHTHSKKRMIHHNHEREKSKKVR